MFKKILRRISGRTPIPYHASLNHKLIKFGGGDFLSARDVAQSVQIFGGTGSGKTSGSGKALADAFLRSGYGGIVCCAKADELERWQRLAKANNRDGDIIVFDISAKHRFNFLDYAMATIGRDGFDNNIVDLLTRIAEAARSQQGSSGGSGDNQFFRDASMQLLANAIPFLRVVYGTIRLAQLYEFITSAPTSPQQADDPSWVGSSYCAMVMAIAGEKARAGDLEAQRICDQHGDYWAAEFASLGDRTRSSIVSTLTSSIYPFLTGKLAELFCTHTTIVPDMCRQGVIIVLCLPVRQFGAAGAVAQQIFKLAFQTAMEAQAVHDTDKTRPVFCWADECQFFMNSYDTEHLSVCRQQKVCNVFITQDMPTYMARLPDEHAAHSLLNKFGVRIFHATTDQTTASYAAEVVGYVERQNVSRSQSTGANTGGGVNIGNFDGSGSGGHGINQSQQYGYSTYKDYDIRPDYFGRELRTGGKRNKLCVDGIVIINGRNFRSSGKNRIKAEFRQA